MILYLSFEELTALRSSTEQVLADAAHTGHGIAAPPQVIAELETLAPTLVGDLHIASLERQQRTRAAFAHLLHDCRVRMDHAILEQHPAAEYAVAAYFDYAHLLTVVHRLDRMYEEMAALAQLMTGDDPDSDVARRFTFPE